MKSYIPNILSTLRIILAIPIFFLVASQKIIWALLIFGLAALTDLFDGKIARQTKSCSDLGEILDGLADKILVGLIFLGIYLFLLGNELKFLFLLFLTSLLILELFLLGIRARIVKLTKDLKLAGPNFFDKAKFVLETGLAVYILTSALCFRVFLVPALIFSISILLSAFLGLVVHLFDLEKIKTGFF